MKENNINPENLYNDTIEVKPVDTDWSELFSSENWDPPESYEGYFCEECNKYRIVTPWEECPKCGSELYAEGPMMNYFYPIPRFKNEEDPRTAAKKIKDLPLTLIYHPILTMWGLALTGGGMDLSWDICLGYIRLGYLPPTHFSDLPRFAGGSPKGEESQLIVNAMKRSLEIKQQWIKNDLEDLERIQEYLNESTPA